MAAGANPSILTCLVAIRAILKATPTRTAGNRKSPRRSSVTDHRRVTSTQVAARPRRNPEAKKSKKSSRRHSPSPPPAKSKNKGVVEKERVEREKSREQEKSAKSDGEASIEEGELSEEELLQKRSALLKELEGGAML